MIPKSKIEVDAYWAIHDEFTADGALKRLLDKGYPERDALSALLKARKDIKWGVRVHALKAIGLGILILTPAVLFVLLTNKISAYILLAVAVSLGLIMYGAVQFVVAAGKTTEMDV